MEYTSKFPINFYYSIFFFFLSLFSFVLACSNNLIGNIGFGTKAMKYKINMRLLNIIVGMRVRTGELPWFLNVFLI